VPLLVNLQPAGEYLGEEYHRAGGVPAVVAELMRHKLIHEDALTVNGKPSATTAAAARWDTDVIRSFDTRAADAGFLVLGATCSIRPS
jgi:dihydroxy-acid dehydratase